jgi:hypothetical protein
MVGVQVMGAFVGVGSGAYQQMRGIHPMRRSVMENKRHFIGGGYPSLPVRAVILITHD